MGAKAPKVRHEKPHKLLPRETIRATTGEEGRGRARGPEAPYLLEVEGVVAAAVAAAVDVARGPSPPPPGLRDGSKEVRLGASEQRGTRDLRHALSREPPEAFRVLPEDLEEVGSRKVGRGVVDLSSDVGWKEDLGGLQEDPADSAGLERVSEGLGREPEQRREVLPWLHGRPGAGGRERGAALRGDEVVPERPDGDAAVDDVVVPSAEPYVHYPASRRRVLSRIINT